MVRLDQSLLVADVGIGCEVGGGSSRWDNGGPTEEMGNKVVDWWQGAGRRLM